MSHAFAAREDIAIAAVGQLVELHQKLAGDRSGQLVVVLLGEAVAVARGAVEVRHQLIAEFGRGFIRGVAVGGHGMGEFGGVGCGPVGKAHGQHRGHGHSDRFGHGELDRLANLRLVLPRVAGVGGEHVVAASSEAPNSGRVNSAGRFCEAR